MRMKPQIKAYFKKVNPLNFKNEEISKIIKLGTGESNLNFLIQTTKDKYLMRFDITNKSLSNFKQEYEILKRLESSNIAQKALFIDASKKFFKDKNCIINLFKYNSPSDVLFYKYQKYQMSGFLFLLQQKV